MRKSRHSRLAVALLGVTLMSPWFAQAQSQDEDEGTKMVAMTADLLVARPLGLAITVGGAAVFLVSLPFTAIGGNVAEAGEVLVVGPARSTFVRCLGCRTSGRQSHSSGM